MFHIGLASKRIVSKRVCSEQNIFKTYWYVNGRLVLFKTVQFQNVYLYETCHLENLTSFSSKRVCFFKTVQFQNVFLYETCHFKNFTSLYAKRSCFKMYTYKNCLEGQNIKKVIMGFELGFSGWKSGALSTEPSRQMITSKFFNQLR